MNLNATKLACWFVFLLGFGLIALGLLGVRLFGGLHESGFPFPGGRSQPQASWPALFTGAGVLVWVVMLLGSPLTAAWPPRRRLAVALACLALVFMACTVCDRWAGGVPIRIRF